MKKNIFNGLKVLIIILLINIVQGSYAKEDTTTNNSTNIENATNCIYRSDGNAIYIGAYTLDFKGTTEAKLVVNLPNGFNFHNFVYSIQPLKIVSHQNLGKTMEFRIKPHMWDGEEKVNLIIETNIINDHGIVPGYYFLVADVNIMNLNY